MSILQNRNTALNFLRHIERGDISAAMTLVAEDAKVWVPGHYGMTKAQLSEFLQLANERFVIDSLALRPFGTTAEGDRVAVEAESSAQLKVGGGYENRYHFLFIFRDGKIRVMNVYTDSNLVVAAVWNGEHTR